MITDQILGMQKSLKVLVIDDSMDSAKLMSNILNHYGCELDIAFDGQDAIPLLMQNVYDLIVLDWHMPRMGGNETLLMLEQVVPNKRKHQMPTPVIIYTSSHHSELSLPDSHNYKIVGHVQKSHSFKTTLRSVGNTLALL